VIADFRLPIYDWNPGDRKSVEEGRVTARVWKSVVGKERGKTPLLFFSTRVFYYS